MPPCCPAPLPKHTAQDSELLFHQLMGYHYNQVFLPLSIYTRP